MYNAIAVPLRSASLIAAILIMCCSFSSHEVADKAHVESLVRKITSSVKEAKDTQSLVDACAIVYIAACKMNKDMPKVEVLKVVEDMYNSASVEIKERKYAY